MHLQYDILQLQLLHVSPIPARAVKSRFSGDRKSVLLKPSSGDIICLVVLCSLWRYKVKLFASLCNLLHTKSNRLWKEKYWNKFRYSYIQCLVFSDNIIIPENITTCSWNDCAQLRILEKFAPYKNQNIIVQITSQILYKTFFTPFFAAVVLPSNCVLH